MRERYLLPLERTVIDGHVRRWPQHLRTRWNVRDAAAVDVQFDAQDFGPVDLCVANVETDALTHAVLSSLPGVVALGDDVRQVDAEDVAKIDGALASHGLPTGEIPTGTIARTAFDRLHRMARVLQRANGMGATVLNDARVIDAAEQLAAAQFVFTRPSTIDQALREAARRVGTVR